MKEIYVCQLWGDTIVWFSTKEKAEKYADENKDICYGIVNLTPSIKNNPKFEEHIAKFKEGKIHGMYPFFLGE